MNYASALAVATRATIAALTLSAFLSIGGCASSGDNSISGFMQVTVKPGDTAQCDSNPCQVFLEIPPGSGSVEVTGNQVKIGTYPAGKTADLGQLFSSQAIAIVGMDVPKAYVYIPVQR